MGIFLSRGNGKTRFQAAAPRLCSGRSALKSVHWTDLTGKPVVPHSNWTFRFFRPHPL